MARSHTLLAAGALFISSEPAWAYIGPGMGAGTIAVILGVLAALFLALFAVLWYPLKRVFKSNKKMQPTAESQDSSAASSPQAPDNKE